jgi:hypothetical protein
MANSFGLSPKRHNGQFVAVVSLTEKLMKSVAWHLPQRTLGVASLEQGSTRSAIRHPDTAHNLQLCALSTFVENAALTRCEFQRVRS